MRSKLLGLGLGLTLSTLGVVAIPTMAFADTTCYTGCAGPAGTSVPVTTPVTTPAPLVTPAAEPAVQVAGLALTGADIEGMAAIGAGALVVGGVMVRRSRRLRRAAA
jgi:hypothetical protein